MGSPLCITIYSKQTNMLLQNTVEVTGISKLTSQKCITRSALLLGGGEKGNKSCLTYVFLKTAS